MTEARLEQPDRKFDESIALVLRAGVLIAALFVLIGGVLYLKQSAPVPNYHGFRGEPQQLRSVSGIAHAALAFQGLALIQFGLLVLIATPIARVALSLAVFLYQKDWIYVGVTLMVLSLLLFSLLTRHG